MIKLNELQPGDLVIAEYEGQKWEGVVKELNKEDKEVCVETEVQEFWFTPEHLYPIPLDEHYLTKLGFQRQDNQNGSVKYSRDSFRVLLPRKDDFTDMEIWWREDRRHMNRSLFVHEFQNHYYQMTKVELSV